MTKINNNRSIIAIDNLVDFILLWADRLFVNLQVDSLKAHELLSCRSVVIMDEQLRKMAELYKYTGKR